MTIEDLERDVAQVQAELDPPLKPVLDGARALLASIVNDESRHGGLITRETIRLSDELRLLINRLEAQESR